MYGSIPPAVIHPGRKGTMSREYATPAGKHRSHIFLAIECMELYHEAECSNVFVKASSKLLMYAYLSWPGVKHAA